MPLPSITVPEEIQEINNTIFSSSSNTIVDILKKWPDILAAIGVILVGFLIMKIIQWTIVKVAKKISLHKLSERSGFSTFLEKAKVQSSPSQVIGNFLGGYVFMMFFLASSNILGLTDISEFLDMVIKYIPKLVVALLIVLIGFQFANTIRAVVESTLNILESGAAKFLGMIAQGIIILFAILTALFQLNIAQDMIKILFTGVVAMIVLAGGLAIGLGSKDLVKDILEKLVKDHK